VLYTWIEVSFECNKGSGHYSASLEHGVVAIWSY